MLERPPSIGAFAPPPAEPVSGDPPDGSDQLRRWGVTDREHEVLLLVAEGRTNGEIASLLFISPKTVSVHISNILAKLGVTSRVQAAGRAHRLCLMATPGEPQD